jgi:hypothetical protein
MSHLVEIDRLLGSIAVKLGAEEGGSSGAVDTLMNLLNDALVSCEASNDKSNIKALISAYEKCVQFMRDSVGELKTIDSEIAAMSVDPTLLESIIASRRTISRDLRVMKDHLMQNKDRVTEMIKNAPP